MEVKEPAFTDDGRPTAYFSDEDIRKSLQPLKLALIVKCAYAATSHGEEEENASCSKDKDINHAETVIIGNKNPGTAQQVICKDVTNIEGGQVEVDVLHLNNNACASAADQGTYHNPRINEGLSVNMENQYIRLPDEVPAAAGTSKSPSMPQSEALSGDLARAPLPVITQEMLDGCQKILNDNIKRLENHAILSLHGLISHPWIRRSQSIDNLDETLVSCNDDDHRSVESDVGTLDPLDDYCDEDFVPVKRKNSRSKISSNFKYLGPRVSKSGRIIRQPTRF